jgi:hypothetical protein
MTHTHTHTHTQDRHVKAKAAGALQSLAVSILKSTLKKSIDILKGTLSKRESIDILKGTLSSAFRECPAGKYSL